MKYLKLFEAYFLNEDRAYNKNIKIILGKTQVRYDKKKGTVVDKNIETIEDEKEKLLMLKIEFNDGTYSWEVADDVKMKFIK